MKTERPVNLALTKFSFPIMAIASITHRITGVLLFVPIAYLLWLLGLALDSPAGFERKRRPCSRSRCRSSCCWPCWPCCSFHILAGLKHMVMDFHHWDTLEAGRRGAVGVFVAHRVGRGRAGVWLW
jgi:succinate dehydrogenase / fumarate reductase, cytochrome b subunit